MSNTSRLLLHCVQTSCQLAVQRVKAYQLYEKENAESKVAHDSCSPPAFAFLLPTAMHEHMAHQAYNNNSFYLITRAKHHNGTHVENSKRIEMTCTVMNITMRAMLRTAAGWFNIVI